MGGYSDADVEEMKSDGLTLMRTVKMLLTL